MQKRNIKDVNTSKQSNLIAIAAYSAIAYVAFRVISEIATFLATI